MREKRSTGFMSEGEPYRVPSASALIAFETAARLGNFSGAARELGTSQSAVSRHIAGLEKQLSARLFERSPTGVSLTGAGRLYHKAVVVGLGALRAGAAEVAAVSDDEQAEVVIACPEEVSHLYVMPRFEALRKALGESVRVRILAGSSGAGHLPPEPAADVILTSGAGTATPGERAVLASEAVRPCCSPGYAAVHADTLDGPVTGWGGLTFLDLLRPGGDRALWERWFAAAGRPAGVPRYEDFDSYVHALEAAVAGRGIVLGWRHLVDWHVDSGLLVALSDDFVETGGHFHAVLADTGRQKPQARACLAFFSTAG